MTDENIAANDAWMAYFANVGSEADAFANICLDFESVYAILRVLTDGEWEVKTYRILCGNAFATCHQIAAKMDAIQPGVTRYMGGTPD